MKIHKNIDQGSLEWQLLRSGLVTASNADSLVTPLGKVKTGEAVKTLMLQVLSEIWIGGPLPSFQGALDMENGKIREESAKPAFTLETNKEVEQVTFIESDDCKIGCSPDGILIAEKAGLEIKSPRLENHLRYLLDGIVPSEYVLQVQFSLYVTQFPKWYFMSFRHNFPSLIIEVLPDEKIQSAIDEALKSFFKCLDEAMAKLLKLNGGLPNQKNRGLKPFPKPQPTEEKIDYRV